MTHPLPANERVRLEALRALRILGTEPDPIIDRICRLAQEMLDVPTAFLSLLDEHEQWFKSKCGLDAAGTSRDVAFCNYTILTERPFVIEDAASDTRFAGNPLVTGDLHIRAYAGVPIALEPGLNLGSLCCIDVKPRTFSARQIQTLEELGAIVVGQLRLHQANLLLEDSTRALDERDKILARTEQLAGVGGFEVDLATRCVRWSDNMYRLHDLAPASPASIDDLLAPYAKRDRALIEQTLEAAPLAPVFQGEFGFTSVAGTRRWVRAQSEIVTSPGQPAKLRGIIQDVSERKAAETRLRWAGEHDPLTGLPNRKLLHDKLESALAKSRATGRLVGLLFVDVDRFKEINDTLGHAAGDALLRMVADRLGRAATSRNLVARMGGDEFAVLVRVARSADEVEALALRLLKLLHEPLEYDGNQMTCQVSVGISVFPDPAGNALELLTQADLALYAAKAAGRNRVAIFHPRMRSRMDRKIGMLTRASDALARHSIVPFYQPKVALGTGRITGFEALLRIVDDGTVTLPAAILDAFDDPALSVAIGERMLECVLADMREWADRDVAFGNVALNVGAPEFTHGFAQRVLGRVTEAGLPADCLQIEVTETVFLGAGSEQVGAILSEFHDAGVQIALDDFGTGYASLSHLRKYPVTWLKIDRSFVKGLDSEPEAAAIVHAVIGLAQSLGIGIVAEGVETNAQCQFLRQRRCDVGQGYLFGKPMAGSRVPGFLRTWKGTADARPPIALDRAG